MEKVCPYSSVTSDGRIICHKIIQGGKEVSPSLCRTCPVRACNCEHLRFSLRKISSSPIVVRYGNGKTEVWDNDPPKISFLWSACAVRVIPIENPEVCAHCSLHTSVLSQPIAPQVCLDSAGINGQEVEEGKTIPSPQPVLAIS